MWDSVFWFVHEFGPLLVLLFIASRVSDLVNLSIAMREDLRFLAYERQREIHEREKGPPDFSYYTNKKDKTDELGVQKDEDT